MIRLVVDSEFDSSSVEPVDSSGVTVDEVLDSLVSLETVDVLFVVLGSGVEVVAPVVDAVVASDVVDDVAVVVG